MLLHLKTYGQGEPLILLHGLFGDGDNWRGIAAALADRFQVLVPDLRNHGRSPHSPEMTFPVMAADVAELLAAQGVPAAAFLGHSLGGKVAMQLALNRPGLVRRLIVADMSPRAYAPLHLDILAALQALDAGSFTSRSEIEAVLAGAIPSERLRRFLVKNLARNAGGTFEWRMNVTALADNYPHLLAAATGPQPYAGPALFLRGGRSEYVPAADEPLILELFPRAQFRTIANAGHWVHTDAPEEFLRLTRDFLGS
jgi:pimeloyl-ACP methyl ester carboxylesterase